MSFASSSRITLLITLGSFKCIIFFALLGVHLYTNLYVIHFFYYSMFKIRFYTRFSVCMHFYAYYV